MHRIKGVPTALPAGLQHMEDLIYYDGPFLSYFRHAERRELYLYYWCDCNEVVQRWMVLRIEAAMLCRLCCRHIPLNAVIPIGSVDGGVFIIDMDDKQNVVQSLLVQQADIPDEYKPGIGTYLDADHYVEVDA